MKIIKYIISITVIVITLITLILPVASAEGCKYETWCVNHVTERRVKEERVPLPGHCPGQICYNVRAKFEHVENCYSASGYHGVRLISTTYGAWILLCHMSP